MISRLALVIYCGCSALALCMAVMGINYESINAMGFAVAVFALGWSTRYIVTGKSHIWPI